MFGEEVGDRALHGTHRRVDGRVGGDEEHRERRVGLAQPRAELEAVHAGHVQVGDEHVEAPAGREGQGLLRASAEDRLVLRSGAEDQPKQEEGVGVVVHDQDPSGFTHGDNLSATGCPTGSGSGADREQSGRGALNDSGTLRWLDHRVPPIDRSRHARGDRDPGDVLTPRSDPVAGGDAVGASCRARASPGWSALSTARDAAPMAALDLSRPADVHSCEGHLRYLRSWLRGGHAFGRLGMCVR